MAAFVKARLANRAGLLDGLANGLLGQDDPAANAATASAAATTAAAGGGILGGVLSGVGGVVSGVVGGVTSGIGEVASVLVGGGGASTTAAATTATSAISATSSATPSPTSSLISATSLSLSSSSSAQPSISLSSAQPSTSSLPSSTLLSITSPTLSPAPTTITPTPSLTAEAANALSTSIQFVSGDTAPTTASTPKGFLENKGLAAGVFTVVGVIGVILLFILATWFVRRRRHDRFTADALDFSPAAHLTGSDDTGYPNSLHRTASGGSQFSRPAPTTTYGRESPDRMYAQTGGYGATQGYGAAAGGYYNRPIPPPSLSTQSFMTTQQMQQAYASPAMYSQPLPAALRPGPPVAQIQNPFETPRNGARSHSPSDSETSLAYAGYSTADGADTRVQVGRKVSLTKASASIRGRPPALQLPETFGNDATGGVKVING